MEVILRSFFGNLLNATAYAVHFLLWGAIIAVAVYWLFSWIPPLKTLPIYRGLQRLVEPVLDAIRRQLFRFRIDTEGFDLAPLVLLLALVFADVFLFGLMRDIQAALRFEQEVVRDPQP